MVQPDVCTSEQAALRFTRGATEYPDTEGKTSENFQEDPFQSIFFCFVFGKKRRLLRP